MVLRGDEGEGVGGSWRSFARGRGGLRMTGFFVWR